VHSGQAHSVDQGKRNLLKNPEWKNIFNTVKYLGQTLFFNTSAKFSKILNVKIYIQFSVTISEKKLFFSGQAQIAQNPE